MFTSELDVQALSLSEAPGGRAFSYFLDALTIFCHDREYSPGTGWETKTKPLGLDYTDAERKIIFSAGLHYPDWYAGSGCAEAGKLIAVFKTKDIWTGFQTYKGKRDHITESLMSAVTSATALIEDKLPAGAKLRRVSETMITKCSSFYLKLHEFLNADLQK